jgi:RNA polymerase sigma-70 factor (ECF subfamily)
MTIDRDLVDRARNGDPEATEALLRLVAPQVHAVCRRICTNAHDADDAAQEALIAVVRGLARFDGRSRVTTWVHRVTTNACLDELRRIRRRPVPTEVATEAEVADPTADPEDRALGSAARRDLATALASLPEEFRVAVVLRDVADLDYAEISEVLGVPPGTVRSRIARGRGRLADLLAEDPEPGNFEAASNVQSLERRIGDPPTSEPAP